jgi:hypothetical protein
MIRSLLVFWRTGAAFASMLLWAWTRGQAEEVREVGDIIAFVAIGLGVMSAWDKDRTRRARRRLMPPSE